MDPLPTRIPSFETMNLKRYTLVHVSFLHLRQDVVHPSVGTLQKAKVVILCFGNLMQNTRLSVEGTTTRRNHAIDIAKGIGILFVVTGHVTTLFVDGFPATSDLAIAVTRVLYAFHMPLFFFLSGCVDRQRTICDTVARSLGLVLFANLTHVLGCAVQFVLQGSQALSPATLFRPLVLETGFSIGVTWFLVALAAIQVLYRLFTSGGIIPKVMVVLVLLLSGMVSQVAHKNWFQIQAIWSGFLFFAAGNFLATQTKVLLHASPQADSPHIRKEMLMIAMSLLGSLFLLVIVAYLNNGQLKFPYLGSVSPSEGPVFHVRLIVGDYGDIPLFLLGAALGISATLSASLAIDHCTKVMASILEWIGRKSLTILILNGFFIMTTSATLKSLGPSADGPLLLIVAVVLVCVMHVMLAWLADPLVDLIYRKCGMFSQAGVRYAAHVCSVATVFRN
jgi:fucose 4-O-acetylase-like acetyltransferase